jgi:hypothetical protein
MKKLLLLSTAILFVISVGFSQTGEIKGIVKDKDTGEPIFGAAVYIEVGGVKQGGTTDPDGKYTIKPVKPGLHQVYMSVVGYQKRLIQKVGVVSNRITYVNSDMDASPEMLVGIDVVEHVIPLIDKDEPYVQIISAKTIADSPQKFNPIAIVGTMPGVTVAANGKDVYVRGSRPQSTQFITDGIRSITGDIGISGQAIGSIKVYTGGVPAQYGDVTGGVIVVETKSYFDYAQQFHQ